MDVSGVRRVVNVAMVSGGPDGVEVGEWVLSMSDSEYEQELAELEASVTE